MGNEVPVEFTPAVLDILRRRSAGACEGCGRIGVRTEAHHRKFRSRGGRGTVDNGWMLCGWGNHTGCHGLAHGPDAPMGWSVASYEDPADEPVTDLRGNVWTLTADGQKLPYGTDPADIVEADPWATPDVAVDSWS